MRDVWESASTHSPSVVSSLGAPLMFDEVNRTKQVFLAHFRQLQQDLDETLLGSQDALNHALRQQHKLFSRLEYWVEQVAAFQVLSEDEFALFRTILAANRDVYKVRVTKLHGNACQSDAQALSASLNHLLKLLWQLRGHDIASSASWQLQIIPAAMRQVSDLNDAAFTTQHVET